MPDPLPRVDELRRLLSHGIRTAAEITSVLAISQPTLSRLVRSAPELFTNFRVAGERTPKYGLLRQLPGGLGPRQSVYQINEAGAIGPFAGIEFLGGGATLELSDRGNVLYDGLPPYMHFASPSGFLGRQVARSVAMDKQFPESLRDWSDEHRIAYLFSRGLNLPGNLVYGDASLQREMEFRELPPVPRDEKLAYYESMANQLKDASYGSSAGGEQPKFLSFTQDVGHVIVKFAKRGGRMADLLLLEHIAQQSLSLADVPAASTTVLMSERYVFLEVQRFDRVGRYGRIGMLSAGAIDDERFGRRDTWSQFATRCEQAGVLSEREAAKIHVMAAFSELIGNGDRHFENISVLLDASGRFTRVAPAYDMLPMRYAPLGGDVDPDLLPVTPGVGTIGARPVVWERAFRAAEDFWGRVHRSESPVAIPEAFRALARVNLDVATRFVAPLLPSTRR